MVPKTSFLHGSLQPEGEETFPALEVAGIVKRFGAVKAVNNVSFSVRKGEMVSLLGPSGCGKSTLLRMIAGIESPDSGKITIRGRDVSWPEHKIALPPEARGLGMVFQSYALWPHMTVKSNVEYPLRCQHVGRAQRQKLVSEALYAVRLDGYERRYPGELSGGQQQRVALARALVGEPAIILLDEPLSNLDARLRDQMRVEIKRLHAERGLTMLYVTHDQSEALALSDRVVVMEHGRVAQISAPEGLWAEPASASIAHFLGASNNLQATFVGESRVQLADGMVITCSVDQDCAIGDTVQLVSRPDGIRAAIPGEAGLKGIVLRDGFLGSTYESVVQLSSGYELIVRAQRRLGAVGDEVLLVFEPGGSHAFRAQE